MNIFRLICRICTSAHLNIRTSILFISFFTILLAGCYLTGNIINENFSSDYREDEKNIHAEFEVFHFSSDSSRFFIQLNTNELLFARSLEEDTFRAAFQVYLKVINSYDDPIVVDTAIKTFHINKTLEGTGNRIYSLDFHLPKPGEYLIQCTIYDSNKKITETDYVNLDNSSPQSRQNFFLHLAGSSAPLFANYLSATDTFGVDYRSEAPQKIFVKYYHREFTLAATPYSFDVRSSFNYKPDSVFTIMSGNDNKYVFVKEGIYHLQLDTTNHEGKTIYRFSSGFPGISTAEALLDPLYYIASRKEFEAMHSSPNKKQAIDKFWLDIGGNQERSRLLIKKYYSRVEKANRLFTSYMEGWRTDRGMVYIVFGSPHAVYKSSNTESWTYGDANSSLSITFNFTKAINPFTYNDYVLSRAPVYETSWYTAIDTWRQGRVFNDF